MARGTHFIINEGWLGGSYTFVADTNLTLTFPGHRHLGIHLSSLNIALCLMSPELPLQSLVWLHRISRSPPLTASVIRFHYWSLFWKGYSKDPLIYTDKKKRFFVMKRTWLHSCSASSQCNNSPFWNSGTLFSLPCKRQLFNWSD